jgi:ribosomal small subunit protein bTHX
MADPYRQHVELAIRSRMGMIQGAQFGGGIDPGGCTMGKGDRKTAMGKRFRKSFGNSRPKSHARKVKRAGRKLTAGLSRKED